MTSSQLVFLEFHVFSCKMQGLCQIPGKFPARSNAPGIPTRGELRPPLSQGQPGPSLGHCSVCSPVVGACHASSVSGRMRSRQQGFEFLKAPSQHFPPFFSLRLWASDPRCSGYFVSEEMFKPVQQRKAQWGKTMKITRFKEEMNDERMIWLKGICCSGNALKPGIIPYFSLDPLSLAESQAKRGHLLNTWWKRAWTKNEGSVVLGGEEGGRICKTHNPEKCPGTHLSRVPKFRCHGPSDSLVNIGTVKHDEWGMATQLHGHPFHRVCCMMQQDLGADERMLWAPNQLHGPVSLCFKKLPSSGKSQVHSRVYEMTVCIRKGENKNLCVFIFACIW